VLVNGKESEESQSAFKKWMSEQAKANHSNKAECAHEKIKNDTQDIVAAVDKAASKKRKERKVRATIKLLISG